MSRTNIWPFQQLHFPNGKFVFFNLNAAVLVRPRRAEAKRWMSVLGVWRAGVKMNKGGGGGGGGRCWGGREQSRRRQHGVELQPHPTEHAP